MSFETGETRLPGSREIDKKPLFSRKFSLDGRVPTSEQMISLRGSHRGKSFLTYGMRSENKFVAAKPRRVSEDPQLSPLNGKMRLEAGVTDYSYERDEETDAITNFKVTLKPEIDLESLPILQSLAVATERDPNLWLSQLQSFFPVCHISAGEGISLYNGDSLVFGYGPAFAESEDGLPLFFGEGFIDQVEIGFADMPDIERRNLQVEYTTYQNIVELQTGDENDGPNIVNIRGGVIVHRTPFRKVEKACRRVLEKNAEDKKRLLNIVEPYYAVTIFPTGSEDYEEEGL
jgi:hypothetical protein